MRPQNNAISTFMEKIKSLADLKKMQENLRARVYVKESSNDPNTPIRVKVAMATCGIASGAKDVMEIFIEEDSIDLI